MDKDSYIEYLYKNKKIPLRYYNQLNSKSAVANYNLFKDELINENEIMESLTPLLESMIVDSFK